MYPFEGFDGPVYGADEGEGGLGVDEDPKADVESEEAIVEDVAPYFLAEGLIIVCCLW